MGQTGQFEGIWRSGELAIDLSLEIDRKNIGAGICGIPWIFGARLYYRS
jgi:hypothetical protein